MYFPLHFYSVAKVEVGRISYKTGHVVVIAVDTEEVPHFAVITEFIITEHTDIFFVCKLLHTIGYCKHYHAYEVVDTPEIVLCKNSQLSDYHPLSVYTSNGSYVAPKYRLFPLH